MKKSFTVLTLIIILVSLQLNAQTWSALKRLTWNSGESFHPSITADTGNIIHVVWQDPSSGNTEIFYKRSTDTGTTWSALKRLTWNSGSSGFPSITTDSGNGVHVVWNDVSTGDFEIFYKRSTDSGATWLTPIRLSWKSGLSLAPTIAADSGNSLHTVWYDYSPGNVEVFYKRSTNSGTTWSTPKRLTWNTGSSAMPVVAADSGSGVHVVWFDDTPGNYEIFYKRSTDKGVTWLAPIRLTWNTGSSREPSLTLDSSNNPHVLWRDETPGNYEIFYKRSTDAGTTWSALKRLTWNGGKSDSPAIEADFGSGVHIVWNDDTPGNEEIFYRSSSDGGITWSVLARLTWNLSWSRLPALASDSSNDIHAVWVDYNPGNYELFYKNRI